ncbi:hypothetical protein GOP47_0004495 [Adiantum capillus-veneris]|uniref:Uncharacterized protein n=1 Tax=Adiantum capillus-veneris TaxID=13818 RepID=A0A9D4V9D6_ADICA|nr:hypothetical protein GOP47_0004495 [Adiantum capillus-veneris]
MYSMQRACKWINMGGCMMLVVYLMLMVNVRCMETSAASGIIQSCRPLVERFNTSTGPPRGGQDIMECDEQGVSLPGDLLQLPMNRSTHNIAAVEETRMRKRARVLYTDGSGTYITSDEVHHYASGVKCWSDYFVVDSGYWWSSWVKASGNLYCTYTSSCSFSHMDGHQTCQSWSISLSTGVESEFIKFSVSLGYEHQDCTTGTDVSQCTWSDGQCHCIWTQQQMTYQHGYKRRRCSSSNGDYTAWMQDVVHDAPTKTISYGCGSKCTDT